MRKFYLVFLTGHEEPAMIPGENQIVTDNNLSITDENGNLAGYFPAGMWQGFVIEHLAPCDHTNDLPSLHQPNTSGH